MLVDLFFLIFCKEKNDIVLDLVFYEGKLRELKIVNKDNICIRFIIFLKF